ncbi:MAG: response regulator [Burkholderiales bacterium]|nr:response regulator [Burkholderiales bacterium]MBH2015925.1 response regulator [Burkholderiales bacterium]
MNVRSLRVFLPLALLALLLAVGSVSLAVTWHQRQKALTEACRQQILADVARLVRLADQGPGLLSSLMFNEVAQASTRPQARMILLVDETGRVIHADRGVLRGKALSEVAPGLDGGRVATAMQGRMADWRMSADGLAMDALQGYALPSRGDEVRSSRRGVVYVAHDLRALRSEATRSDLLARVPDLIGLLLVFGLMGWWLGRHVTRPLARLDRAANALRAGDWSVEVPRGGFLEIDQLGAGVEALRRELAATWLAMPDLLFELDAEGRYLRVVAARPELILQSPTELIGRRVSEVMPPESAQSVLRAIADANVQNCVWGRELALNVPAGQKWFEVSVARKVPLDGGEPTFLLISRDVTERKQAEVSLRKLNEELEARVAARTAELLSAKNEAERANQSKSDFLSRMSHELRTPLNAILGFGQLLALSTQDAKQSGHVRHILGAGQHLLELINEILDLSRVESGQMTLSLEPVSVGDLVVECLALVRPLAEAHGIELLCDDIDASWRVRADRTRMRQVLINLLSNGIKYNRPAGRLLVRLSMQDDALRVSVSDEGEGLTAEQQSRLFVPFERLDADARQIEGTGIGLALSKRLVGLMGGRIGVDSRVGEGSTFWVSLLRCQPLSDDGAGLARVAAPATPTLAQGTREGGTQRTVLCIEDNELNLQLIEHLLSHRPGLSLLTAMTPTVGLGLARERRPDLILLDVNLPEMDGHEVLRRLRADPGTAAIPVIAVTSNAREEDKDRARAEGFSAYVTKPIDVLVLMAEIERLLPRDAAPSGLTPTAAC